MRVVVIGGTGHIGSYLVPRLVTLGHEVISVSRGEREPYLVSDQAAGIWRDVRRVAIDREAAEKAGTFGRSIRDLGPDVVMDLLCFRLDQAKEMVEALRGELQHLVHCGTIWVHGYTTEVPTTEAQLREPFGDYGVRKYEIERYHHEQARRYGFPVTDLHPGHIVGTGWEPIGPTGSHDPEAFRKLARGEELTLPNQGMESVHHVHANDVAQAFVKATTHWAMAVGESFYVVSPKALTLRGYAEGVATWFGRKANLRFAHLDEWSAVLPERYRASSVSHVQHSSCYSPEKAERFIGYQPRYTSLEAVKESVFWLVEHGKLEL